MTMKEPTIPDLTDLRDCSCTVFFSSPARNCTRPVSSIKAVLKPSSYLELDLKMSVKISSVSL